MASKQPNKSKAISVRLEPQIHTALEAVGQRIGVKPAVLAGMAIGDYVTRAEASYGAAASIQTVVAKEMATVLGNQIGSILTAEQLEKMASDEG